MERRLTRREEGTEQRPGASTSARAEAVRPGSLAWASAVGNHAVQRLARQPIGGEQEAEDPEAAGAGSPAPEPAVEAEEAPPPEVGALQGAGIGHESLAGLAAVDQLGEDALPD
jgi:hypothetical protein